MAVKKYSAGTIFLQVSPVFRRFQEDVQDYVKDIDRALGDDMEKSGRKAGQRAGKAMGEEITKEAKKTADDYAGHFETSVKRFVKNAEKEIGRLDLSSASKGMLDDLDVAKKKLRELNDQDFNVDFDSKKVINDLAKVQTSLENLTKGDHHLNVDSNMAKVLAEVKGALKFIDKEVARTRNLDIDVMTGAAERKMGAFERKIKSTMERAADHVDGSMNSKVRELGDELRRLSKLKVGVDISATRLQAESRAVMAELKRISETDVEVDARFNAGRAYAELKAFDKALDHVDGRTVRVRATANTSGAQRGLTGVARSGDDAANSFRSFNAVILAVAGAGPALVPVLGAIAGGLLAIGPAAAVAGASLGSVLLGFSGIGDAVGALNDREDARTQTLADMGKASEAAARSGQAAARAEVDGARRVADARRAAARQVESALRSQKDAQERYKDSVEAVREAEIALAAARRGARSTGADIKERISDNKLAQDQALLDVFNATVRNDAVQSDGSATNAEKEQSRIDLERSRDALDDLRKEAKKLAAEQKKWRKEGVDGTDEVKSAQENLNDALDAQQDAYEDLRDAARAVDRARADGARSVADAIRDQKRAMEDANRASRDAADAMQAISTEQQKVEDAFGKLGPAGKRFARFLHGLREGFFDFRNDVQRVLLPQIEEAMASFLGSSNGSVLRKSLINLADSFGRVATALSLSFQGEAWGEFFEMLGSLGPEIQEAWGDAFIYFLEAMASILTTLAPYALEFAEGFAAMMEAFAGWAASEDGANGIQRFMDYVKEIGPSVLDFFAIFVLALTNAMVALAPYGELILGLITSFLEVIAGMDPDTLGLILSTVLVLITASQLAYALLNLLLAGRVLLGSAIGLMVFSFVALGLAIYYVYTQNETLGKALAIIVGTIYAVVLALKIWRATAALVAAIQVGLTAASYGAAGATYAQAGAARFAYMAARLWAGAQWLVTAAMNGTLLQMIRMNAAMALMIAKQKAVIVFTKLWAVAQRILNAAMRANPLGIALTAVLAIAAGFAWAYKKFEGFRNLVDGVINFLKDAFFGLWDFLFGHSVMPDIVDGMEWFFDQVKMIFGWVNTYAIQPLAAAFKWLWANVIRPVLKFIVSYYTFVFKAMKAVWNSVLWPVLKVIGKVVWTLWKAYFKVALTLIKAYFTLVFKAMKWVWENVLRPVFTAIGKALGWLWDKVFSPIFGWIGDKVGDTFRGIKVVWEKVLKPIFDFMVDKALPKLKGAFEKAVDGITKVWNGLKKVVGKPVKFVLDTVINKGLIGGFNKVAKWVGMDGFDEIEIPQSLQSYATGGVLPGYTPGRDPHKFVSPTGGRLELSGGEAIMRPEFTAAVGTGFVDAANAAARSGGIDGVRRLLGEGGKQAFAGGGVFWPVPKGWYVNRSAYNLGHDGMDINHPNDTGSGQGGVVPFMSATSGRVSYTGYGRGYGNAVFVNSPYGELVYGHGYPGSLRVGAGQSVNPGQVLGLIGNTGNSSAPHLHFGFPGGSFGAAEALLSGAGVLSGGDVKASGGKGFGVPGWIKSLLKNPLSTVKEWASSKFSQASDFVKASPVFDVFKNVPSKLASGFKDEALDIIPGWAKKAAGFVGKGIEKVTDLAGSAVGLIPGVGGQDEAPAAAPAAAYANGGVLPYNGTMKYDSGGYLPPGLTSVMNLTGKPEPVFTNDQWAQMGSGTPGDGFTYAPTFQGSDLTAADVAGDLNFTFRKIRRGGRYEEVGRP